MPIREFEGIFIKIKKPTPLQKPFEPPIKPSLYETCCWYVPEHGMEFDEELYKRVGDEIKIILGEKEKYSVQEAVRYFQTKYLAYRVPFEFAFYYQDPYLHKDFIPCDTYCPEDEFEYDHTSGEQNITLIVDTIHNKALRERYPKIEQYEKVFLEREENYLERDKKELQENSSYTIERKSRLQSIINLQEKRFAENEIGHNNPIIVIGYFEENIINAMYILNNFPIAIDDIHYEMYYFYKHS